MGFHIMGVYVGGGGGERNCSRQASLSEFFLCYLATFFPPVTDNLVIMNSIWVYLRMKGTCF